MIVLQILKMIVVVGATYYGATLLENCNANLAACSSSILDWAPVHFLDSIRVQMQHLDAISLGVFSYLQAHERVSRVESTPFVGATQVELNLWEQKNSPNVLPDDLKRFYSIANGLSVKWFAPFRGHFLLNSIQDLQPMSIKDLYSQCRTADQHRLDLRKISHKELVGFSLESSPKYGTIVLIYLDDAPQIWFKDLQGKWSFLAETFTNYYRMMLTHLGIISWQTIFSDTGVDPMRKSWLHLFIPNRMMLDERNAQD